MDLSVDAFHALARSSPWRWRSLHFRHRDDREPEGVEAWVVRPDWLLVRSPTHGERVVTESLRAPMIAYSSDDPEFVPPPPPEPQWAMDATPAYRPDGLVAERPDDWSVQYDDPLYEGYTWVAMLDPQELSHHVTVADLRTWDRRHRETWWATLRAEEGYEARCPDCCDLLYGGSARGLDHEVALDVQTGIVVSLRTLESERDFWIENEILAVDDDVVLPR